MTNAFETWKFGDMAFIAFPVDAGVHVIDQAGNNYGSWRTVDSFRESQRKRSDISKPFDDGKVALSGRLVKATR